MALRLLPFRYPTTYNIDMVHLSERTLQGMRRAYEDSLDGTAILYLLQKADTATGRSSSYARVQVDNKDLDPVGIRVDPAVIDEQQKSMAVEKGNEAFLSVPVDAPILRAGDQIRVLDSNGNETETYDIRAAAMDRSGVTFDRKYRAVRSA